MFHYIKTIGRFDVESITFTVTASDLSYIIVVDDDIIESPSITMVDSGGNRTYTYTGSIPAGALFEFYYNIPLTQPDRFSSENIDIMVSKALCRINRIRYAIDTSRASRLDNKDRVSTFAAFRLLRALDNNRGILIEPITSPTRPTTSIGILADFYNSAFGERKPFNTVAEITEGGSYYILTPKGNANIMLFGHIRNSFLTEKVSYSDFNIYTLDNAAGLYVGYYFCGEGIQEGIPKLPMIPATGAYFYPSVSNEFMEFKYTPYQPPYRYVSDGSATQQIPVEQFPYRIRTMFSVLGSSSDIRTLNTIDYSTSDYIGKIEIPLQDTLGYYYIDIESLGNVVVTDNQYFPYDTSFINMGEINPTDFWVKNERLNALRSIIRYKTTNKVMPADATIGSTKMEFILL